MQALPKDLHKRGAEASGQEESLVRITRPGIWKLKAQISQWTQAVLSPLCLTFRGPIAPKK